MVLRVAAAAHFFRFVNRNVFQNLEIHSFIANKEGSTSHNLNSILVFRKHRNAKEPSNHTRKAVVCRNICMKKYVLKSWSSMISMPKPCCQQGTCHVAL